MEELQSTKEEGAYAATGAGWWGAGYVWQRVYRMSCRRECAGPQGIVRIEIVCSGGLSRSRLFVLCTFESTIV
jgi:hypothetical protein